MSEAQQKTDNDTNEPDKLDKNLATDTELAADDRPHRVTDEGDTSNNKGKGFTGVIAFIALIIAIVAFVANYKGLDEIGTEQATLGNRLNATAKSVAALESGSESSRSIAESVRTSNQQMQNRLDSMDSKVNAINSKVDSSVSKVDSSVSKVDSSVGKLDSSLNELQQNNAAINESIAKLSESIRSSSDDELLVAEARHLITIANHQAQLNHNPAAAAAALEAADQRLTDTSDPSLLKARQIITDDIIALRNVATHDISGIALTLSQLEKSVTGLPLKDEEPATSAEAESAEEQEQEDFSGISGFFKKIWHDIKGLVTVRRNSDEVNAALLPPGQRFFLQQNLRLRLQTARLALLQRDTQTFHDSLNTATQWLETYFDSSAASTANLLSTIASYQDIELIPDLPDISKSLKALDEWSSNQQNAAATTTVEVAAS